MVTDVKSFIAPGPARTSQDVSDERIGMCEKQGISKKKSETLQTVPRLFIEIHLAD